MTDTLDNDFAAEDAEHLAEVAAKHPGREAAILPYADRRMAVLRPTEGQQAAIARMLRSSRIDDLTKVSNLLDILEALLADSYDQAWLSDRMLGGDMDVAVGETIADLEAGPPSAMGLLRKIAQAFAAPANREERRETVRKARRGTR